MATPGHKDDPTPAQLAQRPGKGLKVGTPEQAAAASLARSRRKKYIDRLDASTEYVHELESAGTSFDDVYRGLTVWLLGGIRDGSFRIRHAADAATVLRAVTALFDHQRSDEVDKRAWRTQLQALAVEAANQVASRTGDEPQQDAAPPPLTDDGEK